LSKFGKIVGIKCCPARQAACCLESFFGARVTLLVTDKV
jgi:hypothetical protein